MYSTVRIAGCVAAAGEDVEDAWNVSSEEGRQHSGWRWDTMINQVRTSGMGFSFTGTGSAYKMAFKNAV